MKIKIFYRTLLLLSLASVDGLVSALEINEKLTFSILTVSDSKGTILINKGKEDGLNEGDHAKFYTTNGIVARGVVAKTSPNRSVWSVYRKVNADLLAKGSAFNLKITAPVKLTDDPAQGVEEQKRALEATLNKEQKEFLESRSKSGNNNISTNIQYKSKLEKSGFEMFGNLHYSMMNSTVTKDTTSVSGPNSSRDFSLGAEFFLFKVSSAISSISLFAFFESSNGESLSTQGDNVKNSVTEYGGGIRYLFSDPRSIEKLIWSLNATLGMGNATDSVSINRASIVVNEPSTATTQSFGVGAQAKYILSSGLGLNAELNYYKRAEAYASTSDTTSDASYIRTVSGPRFKLGLSWRF